MDFIIRKCRLEDTKDICQLNRNELGYDYPENAGCLE